MSRRGRGLGLALRALGTLAALLLLVFPLVQKNQYYQNMLILTFLLAVLGLGWNIISGYTGYISLGQSAFIGIGGYTVALLSMRLPVSPFLLAPIGGLLSAVIAALLGLLVMRTRGHAFVIITIAFLFISQTIVRNWSSLTNGSHGLTLPLPDYPREYQLVPFYYAMLLLTVLSLLLSWWIRRTKFGMGLVAIREDEDKAAAIGVHTRVYKTLSFAASSVLVGMAGGVYAYYLSFIDPVGMFNIILSVQTVLAVMLGGRGTLWGPVLGAFIIEPMNEYSTQYFGASQLHLVVFGALMAAVVLFLPQGIIPTIRARLEKRSSASTAAVTQGAAEPKEHAAT